MCVSQKPQVPDNSKNLGGDPSAGSPTDTLCRLNLPCRTEVHLKKSFTKIQLGWFDGRCVQGAGTYSPFAANERLLGIPAS